MNKEINIKKSYLSPMDYREHIEINPDIRFGKPCVKGTRISVYDVLSWLSLGMSNDEIIEDYPSLTIESIRACLAYAADKGERLRSAS